jgi:hypothetical protein
MIERVLTPHLRLDGLVLCVQTLNLFFNGYKSRRLELAMISDQMAPIWLMQSLEGRALCKKILTKYLAYKLHNYYSICPVIDFVGLYEGNYHFIQCSNRCDDIQNPEPPPRHALGGKEYSLSQT